MQCRNHPEIDAGERCVGCMEPYCTNCIVTIRGQKYCSSCKIMAVGDHIPVVEKATQLCEKANKALMYSIIGIFCFGIVLEPIAIAKAMEARKLIRADPTLTGYGKTMAALIIAILGLLPWVLAITSIVSSI